jgi:hypothetical protein
MEYYHGQYSPINQLYYTALFQINGYDPVVFHSAGFIFHVINAVLIYYFILKLLRVTALKIGADESLFAFIVSLISAIHPLFLEPVAWLSASKVVLHSVFYLSALLCYLKFIEHNRKIMLLLTYCFFVMSFLSKEQAVTLPLTLVLIDYLVCNGLSYRSLLKKVPFFCLSLFFGWLTLQSQKANGQGALTANETYHLIDRICFAGYSLYYYFIETLFPYKIAHINSFPHHSNKSIPVELYIYPLLCIVFVILFWKKMLQDKCLLFGFAFFLINICVAVHIIPISRIAIVSDRYTYVSSLGIIFIAVYLWNRWYNESSGLIKKCILFGATIYVFYIGFYTFNRVPVWHDSKTLKNDVRSFPFIFKS